MYLVAVFHSLDNFANPWTNVKRCTLKYSLLLPLLSAYGRKSWVH